MEQLGKALKFLEGKKSYIMVGVTIATAAAQALGYSVPEWVYGIETALLGTAIRVGIKKS
jgi:hypothetical protein